MMHDHYSPANLNGYNDAMRPLLTIATVAKTENSPDIVCLVCRNKDFDFDRCLILPGQINMSTKITFTTTRSHTCKYTLYTSYSSFACLCIIVLYFISLVDSKYSFLPSLGLLSATFHAS